MASSRSRVRMALGERRGRGAAAERTVVGCGAGWYAGRGGDDAVD